MDEKQAERILVFGFVHALLREPNPIVLFRVIEPPDVTLSTDMTASPAAFAGGPFLIYPGDSAKVAQVKNKPDFVHVIVGVLTTQHVLNNIFRVTEPTKILVVKGEPAWGRTDMTLDAMKIPYSLTTHSSLQANPSMIFSYTLIVIDCNGWNGHIPTQIADNIRSHVNAGHEVIFTDRALSDLDSTFPGYVTVSGVQPTDKVTNSSDTYVYSPPRKYDPTKFGASADRSVPEYPSQYYNPPPRPNEIKVFTESMGYVISSVASAKVDDVQVLVDSKDYGTAGNQYAILAFYFEYGAGIVEGLAFHPQQQVRSVVGNNGYYAVYQMYGNKFLHGPSYSRTTTTSVAYTVTMAYSTSTTTTRGSLSVQINIANDPVALAGVQTVAVTVLDPSGQPVPEAQVHLEVTYPSGQVPVQRDGQTDRGGSYSATWQIAGLPENVGAYQVRVSATKEGYETGQAQATFQATGTQIITSTTRITTTTSVVTSPAAVTGPPPDVRPVVAIILLALLFVAALAIIFARRSRVTRPSERVCPHCGFTNPPYARLFCIKCGKPLEAP
jgi:hypothetical protein